MRLENIKRIFKINLCSVKEKFNIKFNIEIILKINAFNV